MRSMILMAVITVALALSATASPASSSRYFIDGLRLSNTIEAQGFAYKGKHIDVDGASCSGLRRYGVHSNQYGLDKFWIFNCEMFTPGYKLYTAIVWATRDAKHWYWDLRVTDVF